MQCRVENKLQYNSIPPHFLPKNRAKQPLDLGIALFLSCADVTLLIHKGKISAKVELNITKSEIVGDS